MAAVRDQAISAGVGGICRPWAETEGRVGAESKTEARKRGSERIAT
jgi:hypothetical protein